MKIRREVRTCSQVRGSSAGKHQGFTVVCLNGRMSVLPWSVLATTRSNSDIKRIIFTHDNVSVVRAKQKNTDTLGPYYSLSERSYSLLTRCHILSKIRKIEICRKPTSGRGRVDIFQMPNYSVRTIHRSKLQGTQFRASATPMSHMTIWRRTKLCFETFIFSLYRYDD